MLSSGDVFGELICVTLIMKPSVSLWLINPSKYFCGNPNEILISSNFITNGQLFVSKGKFLNSKGQDMVTLQMMKESTNGESPVKEMFLYILLADSIVLIPKAALIGSRRNFKFLILGTNIFLIGVTELI